MLAAIMKATKLSKLSLGLIVLGVIIAAAAVILITQDKRVDEGVERGAANERAATAGEQVKRTETANKAEAEAQASPDKRRAVCSKYSNTPENCR